MSARNKIFPEVHHRGLRSLWDMLTLDAKTFTALIHNLFRSEMMMRNIKGVLPPETRQIGDRAAEEIIGLLQALDLPVSVKTAEHMLKGATTAENAHAAFRQLSNTFALELALLWQIFWIDRRNWIPESDFQ